MANGGKSKNTVIMLFMAERREIKEKKKKPCRMCICNIIRSREKGNKGEEKETMQDVYL